MRYDAAKKEVTANHPLQSRNLPVMTYGEDEQGEVYMTTALGGGIIFRFQRAKK